MGWEGVWLCVGDGGIGCLGNQEGHGMPCPYRSDGKRTGLKTRRYKCGYKCALRRDLRWRKLWL